MHIERLQRDNVVIIVQLARLGAEAQVGNGGERNGAGFEAGSPYLGFLVLELYFQRLFLVVSEANFGGNGCGSKTSCLERARLVMVLYLCRIFNFLTDPTNNQFKKKKPTEQPASSFAFPSWSLSYVTELFPTMAITYGKVMPGRLFL
jgi:hypothetical protein